MDTILEILAEVLILMIFRYPGAFLRWVFTGCRRPFKEVLAEDAYTNGTIGLVVIASIIAWIVL